MDLFEYQGKQYFARYGIPVSPGGVAVTPDEAVALAERVGYPVVVKAQVQVGGRGKAGGIKLAGNADEARAYAGSILGMDIKGHTVRRVWVEHASDIAKRVLRQLHPGQGGEGPPGHGLGQGRSGDRAGRRRGPRRHSPAPRRPFLRVRRGHGPAFGRRRPASTQRPSRARSRCSCQLYRCFVEGDADLVEVNPLDPHPGRPGARPGRQGDPGRQRRLPPPGMGRVRRHRRAGRAGAARPDEFGLQYVGLDGFVGIIANGAGLAMSTCDVVNQVGRPAG